MNMPKVLTRLLRYAWPAPYSVAGLILGALGIILGARARTVDGTLEVAGGRLAAWICRLGGPGWRPAVTLGHVILGADQATLSGLRDHEQVHVRQYEHWGLLFGPAYLLLGLVLLLRGRHPYRDNPFERQARALACRAARTGSRLDPLP